MGTFPFSFSLHIHRFLSLSHSSERDYRICLLIMNPECSNNAKVTTRMSLPRSILRFILKKLTLVRNFSLPMGIYGTSTFHQGTPPTPAAHPVPSSSNCQTIPTITAGPVRTKRSLEKKFVPRFPEQTPAPEVSRS